jgi:hypothetical protein
MGKQFDRSLAPGTGAKDASQPRNRDCPSGEPSKSTGVTKRPAFAYDENHNGNSDHCDCHGKRRRNACNQTISNVYLVATHVFCAA